MLQFDFSGGALCLDFVNTVASRQRPETEHLRRFADLVAWARQGGVLEAEDARRVERLALRSPADAAAVLTLAVGLREALYRLFTAIASGAAPSAADLSLFNANLAQTVPDLRVAWRRRRFTFEWTGRGRLDGMLGPVLRSAAELLTSAEAAQVRECASATCTWLFIDRSRTHRRRWCSMQTCGNRNKARRHYERVKRRPVGEC